MLKSSFKLGFILIILIFYSSYSSSEIINDIKINGNERISKQTIILFSKAKIDEDVNEQDLNYYLKNLYDTNFFKDISIKLENNILLITVIEEPIIQSIIYKGVKAQKILDPIKKNTILKDRSSFKEN